MMNKYEMSAMEYLLRYGKDGKKVERKRKIWGWIWFGINISLMVGIVWGIVQVVR